MEKIKKLIKGSQLDEALEIINEEIANSINLQTDKYHQLFFAKGIVSITKYESIEPANNEFVRDAKDAFAHADNAYRAMHGQQFETYREAIIYADRVFVNLNTKAVDSAYRQVPSPSKVWRDSLWQIF